jgi:hypothetical protein
MNFFQKILSKMLPEGGNILERKAIEKINMEKDKNGDIPLIYGLFLQLFNQLK